MGSWSCFSSEGPRNLFRVQGIRKIPENVTSESACPCQETKTGSSLALPKEQWSETCIQINTKMVNGTQNQALPWPSQSPDLNLWAELKRRVHRRGHRTLDDLERFCKEEWSPIPFSVFYNLVWCCRRRLRCFIGKGRLYKVLNAGVPMIVAHKVLLKIIILLLNASIN